MLAVTLLTLYSLWCKYIHISMCIKKFQFKKIPIFLGVGFVVLVFQ